MTTTTRKQQTLSRACELALLEPRLLFHGVHDPYGYLDITPAPIAFHHRHAHHRGPASALSASPRVGDRHGFVLGPVNRRALKRRTVTAASTSASAASTPSSPLSAVPALNSNPGAKATIYLDFVGAAAMSWGSFSVPATPAYDTDSDPSTFSGAELGNINEIWSRISEKFSPFNINVTTVDPGSYANRVAQRIVVGGAGAWLGSLAGGVSYVGSFTNSSPNTSWVFSTNLGSGDPKYTAEAAAHETGHAFDLGHQSVYSGTTKTNEYNPGTATKAPIMGNSYSAARGLWWLGQSGASSSTIQDDVSIITNATNGFGYRADDHGNTVGTSDALATAGTTIIATGVIENIADVDMFRFTTGAGVDTFTLNMAQYGGMLNGTLTLLDLSGNVLASADTATLGEVVSQNLAAGTYVLAVASHGSNGDLGQYSVVGAIVQPAAVPPAAVTGRHVFYNNSYWDGNTPSAGPSDDGAIATDKQALLPGQTATVANYTSYDKGINGVMVDVSGLAAGSALSASDFTFMVGNSNDPSTWSAAPAPATVLVRRGAGDGGSDRVELVWADGAIQKQWLQVTMLADAATGLSVPDTFYFGNAVGEAGDSAGNAMVDVTDELSARNNQTGFLNPAALTNPYDYNRDRIVDVTDQLIARNNQTGLFSRLNLIAAPALA